MDKLTIRKLASDFRAENGMDENDPLNPNYLLRKLNVLAIYRNLSDSFSGMAVKSNDLNIIVINSAHSIGRQNFTIAHELYHLFKQPDFQSMECNTGVFSKSNEIELTADWFAAYLLIPPEALFKIIPIKEVSLNSIKLETILAIEQYYQCSRTALLISLKEQNLIDDSKYNEYKKDVIKNAKILGYDEALYKPTNANMIIGNYASKAKHLFDENIISETEFYTFMRDAGYDIDEINEDSYQE